MTESKIKNLLFDFGGVLIDLDKPRCIHAFEQLGFSGVSQWVDAYSQQGIFRELELGTISPEEFCHRVRSLTGSHVTDSDIWRAWNLLLDGIPTYRLEALLDLRKRYRLFLLSNTNEVHWEYACQHCFPYKGNRAENYFEQMFLSCRMQMVKPDAVIFEEVCRQTDIRPEETLFIDDSEANCRTAASLGFSTYRPSEREDWRKIFD